MHKPPLTVGKSIACLSLVCGLLFNATYTKAETIFNKFSINGDMDCGNSNNSKNDYEILRGTVVKTMYVPAPPCPHPLPNKPNPRCPFDGQRAFAAIISPISIEGMQNDNAFGIRTSWEDYSELKIKEPYMTVGETYAFCGRAIHPQGETKKSYIIDDVGTITKIKE